jgi:hypothetical protein
VVLIPEIREEFPVRMPKGLPEKVYKNGMGVLKTGHLNKNSGSSSEDPGKSGCDS